MNAIRTTLREDVEESSMSGVAWLDLEGCMRTRSPGTTLSWIQGKLDRCGVSRVADVTGLDRIGIPVAIAVRPLARSLSVSQGKGCTLEAAMVSAIMESVEVWHAERPREPDEVASHEALTRGGLSCLAATELVPNHEALELWNPRATQRWHRAMDVISSRELLIPEAVLSIDTVGRSLDSAYCTPTTNGLASGNDRIEAICHSAFEIVERHAFTRWYRLSRQEKAATAVDVKSIRGVGAGLIEQVLDAGFQIHVFDLGEHALGLACFVAEIANFGDPLMPNRPYTGRGLHVSSEIALVRAITESAQSRLTMISGAREDNFHEDYYLWDPAQSASGGAPFSPTDIRQLRSWQSDPIGFLRDRLVAHGFERWVLYDHSRTDPGVPVVHGYITGMDHLRV